MKKMLLLLIISAGGLYAGNTGKISGVAKDRETGDPLPGVNIILEGTTIGAATNLNGEYTILNVPAGVYTISSSMISYSKLTKQNVRIIPDFTTRIDFELVPSTVTAEDIVVVATRPLIQKDQTMTMTLTSSDEIKNLPVRGFQDVANLGVGIVVNVAARNLDGGNGNVNIRGGRASETGVYMDGFQQNNLLTGISTANVPSSAVEEVQVITGGFDAEYGRNQSGIIQVTTKSGGQQYNGSVEFVGDPAGLGIAESYGYKVVSAGLGGPLIPGNNRIRFFVSGEARNIDDANPSVWGHPQFKLTPNGIKNPDPTANDTVEFKTDEQGRVVFKKGPRPDQFSGVGVNSDRGFDLQGKLSFDILANRLRLDVTANHTRSWRRVYTAQRVFSNDDNQRRENTNLNIGTMATYTINPTSFFDMGVNVFSNERRQFNDRLGFDVTDYNASSRGGTRSATYYGDNVLFDIGRGNLTFRKDVDQYLALKSNYVNQVDKHNQLKAGFDYFYHTIRFLNVLDIGNPVNGANDNIGYELYQNGGRVQIRNVNSDNIDDGRLGPAHPYSFAGYVQNKMEYEGLVVRAGIRYDLFNPGVRRLKDLGNPTGENQILESSDYESARNDQKISPRLSVSFPVSEKTQFRMSYGKFFQQPNLQNLYVSPDFLERQSIAPPFAASIGNPNLEAEESTQYEVGLRRALSDAVALDINAYYKDIQGLINTRAVASYPNGLIVQDNQDEGVVQGVSLSLEMRRTSKFSGRIAYTLQSARGSGSGENSGFRSAWLGFSSTKINAPLNFDQRHTINALVDVRNLKGEGPSIGGMRPLENAGVNFVLAAGSGFPYTPTQAQAFALVGVPSARVIARRNSQYQPWTLRLDMKADKTINLNSNMSLNVYVQVLNLLDRKNIIAVYTGSGRPDDVGYTPSASDTRQRQQYDVLTHDGLFWDTPRQARMGVIFNF
ncbi:MAG: TonB-dependent receptor [Bacteroidetes bacterium]|nr:TonB-dependent receptor [Bacteroidota bacterium]